MSANPATTTIKVKDITSGSDSRQYAVKYEIVPTNAIVELVKISEKCKQTVSYDCTNAAVFSNSQSWWYAVDRSGSKDWGNVQRKCGNTGTGERVLTKEKGIPISKVRFSSSNVTFTIGPVVCSGGN